MLKGLYLIVNQSGIRAQVEFPATIERIVYKREKLKPLLTGRSLIEGVRVMQEMYGFPGKPEILAQERLAIVKEFLSDRCEFYRRISGFLRTNTRKI